MPHITLCFWNVKMACLASSSQLHYLRLIHRPLARECNEIAFRRHSTWYIDVGFLWPLQAARNTEYDWMLTWATAFHHSFTSPIARLSVGVFTKWSYTVVREGKRLSALQTCLRPKSFQAFPRSKHGSDLSLITSSCSDVSFSINIPVLIFVVGHVMIWHYIVISIL